jgi:hypothetical protein
MSPTLHAPVYALHIEVESIEPAIWRRIEVPASVTLRTLHDIIQRVMGWQDSHMHLFDIDGVRYGFGDNEWDDDEQDDSEARLGDVVPKSDVVFRYSYDFGDGWEHTIRVEQIRRDVPEGDVPRLLGGARACPPEDCGGVSGYYDLLDAIADPEHEEHESMLEWLGGGYDPEEYDNAEHDRALAPLRRGRATARRGRKSGPALRGTRDQPAASPAMPYAGQLIAVLDDVQRELALPTHISDVAAELLRIHSGRDPHGFLAVRKPGIWVAAALHASFMLHPRWARASVEPMTLSELSELFGVSPASISARSGQLRAGVSLRPLLR